MKNIGKMKTKGAALVEYVVLIAGLVLFVLFAVSSLGIEVKKIYEVPSETMVGLGIPETGDNGLGDPQEEEPRFQDGLTQETAYYIDVDRDSSSLEEYVTRNPDGSFSVNLLPILSRFPANTTLVYDVSFVAISTFDKRVPVLLEEGDFSPTAHSGSITSAVRMEVDGYTYPLTILSDSDLATVFPENPTAQASREGVFLLPGAQGVTIDSVVSCAPNFTQNCRLVSQDFSISIYRRP